MRKFYLTIFLICLAAKYTYAQRMLEVVSEPFYSTLRTASTDGHVVFAPYGQDFLLKYNDISVSRYYYPSIGGARPRFFTSDGLVSFASSTYLVLRSLAGSALYAFNGGSFSRISIPGAIESRPVLFEGNLYILSRDRALIRLYRFDGAIVSEVPFADLPTSGIYELMVTNHHLYLFGRRIRGALPYILKRFDGTSVFTFPYFDFSSGLQEIISTDETGRAYFRTSYSTIFYFDGSSFTSVFPYIPGSHTETVVWRNNLYLLNTVEPTPVPVPIHRLDGSTLTSIPMPPGSNVFTFSNLAVFNDALYVQVTDGAGDSKILSYDGTSFSDFFSIPGMTNSYGTLFVRDGNLIIQPEIQNGNVAYEYNGSGFTTIEGPADHVIGGYLGATTCNHLWLMSYIDRSTPVERPEASLVKESKSCVISTPTLVIPRRFFEFERFDAGFATRGERECWSDIIINWVLDPICPVPEICPRPGFLITLSDMQDKIAWQQKFDKSTIAQVPLDGKLPFKTVLSITDKNPQDLILIDQDLVQKGITGIGFSMNPKRESFLLSATTRQGTIVPLELTLLNKDGKPLWKSAFKAPFIISIKDRVSELGEMLRFSSPELPEPQLITQQEISASNSFTHLNPSHGTLTIDMKDRTVLENAEISITNMLGQKLISQKISNPVQSRLMLPPYRPGLFVINIRTKDGKVMNKIVWLK